MPASGIGGTDGGSAEPSILIVEDCTDLSEPLSRLLRRVGYVTAVIESGGEAILHLQDHRPSLVILDLILPDMDGVDVLRWVRLKSSAREMPVVIYTSSTDQEVLRMCADAGATEIWIKGGLDFFQIRARVSRYVPPPP